MSRDQFLEYYIEYHKCLRNWCYSMRYNPEYIDDVCQSTWMQAWKYKDSFKGDSKFSTWLFTIAKNEYLMMLRKYKPTEELDTSIVKVNSLTPETVYNRIKIDKALESPLLNGLAEGYSFQELADQEGISLPAIKSRIHRTRATYA